MDNLQIPENEMLVSNTVLKLLRFFRDNYDEGDLLALCEKISIGFDDLKIKQQINMILELYKTDRSRIYPEIYNFLDSDEIFPLLEQSNIEALQRFLHNIASRRLPVNATLAQMQNEIRDLIGEILKKTESDKVSLENILKLILNKQIRVTPTQLES